jgi:hypothetical protein
VIIETVLVLYLVLERSHHCHLLLQQLTLFKYVIGKRNPATRESYSSKNSDYTSGWEQQQAIIENKSKSTTTG